MSVVSFEEKGEVWGAASPLIYSMLLFMIQCVGPKEYLVRFKKYYDHMYNFVPLQDITVDELCEFRGLVVSYIEGGEYESFSEDSNIREEIRASLARLVEMIDQSIMKRRPV